MVCPLISMLCLFCVVDLVSYRWFMPVNIALTFLFGWVLGWIVIKLLKPKPYLEGLVMAASSTGSFSSFPSTLFELKLLG